VIVIVILSRYDDCISSAVRMEAAAYHLPSVSVASGLDPGDLVEASGDDMSYFVHGGSTSAATKVYVPLSVLSMRSLRRRRLDSSISCVMRVRRLGLERDTVSGLFHLPWLYAFMSARLTMILVITSSSNQTTPSDGGLG